jgi:hypothetical protein
MNNRIKFLAFSLILSSNIFSGYDSNDKVRGYAMELYKNREKDAKSLNILQNLLPNDFHKEFFSYKVREKVRLMANHFSIPEEWLYFVFNIECKGNPTAVNDCSNATGLIQFMPSTALSLGTTVENLEQMSTIDQLDYVQLYLERINPSKKFNSFTDLYLAVFFPVAIGKNDAYVLGSHKDEAYIKKISHQNPAIDTDKNGSINKEEFEHFAESKC